MPRYYFQVHDEKGLLDQEGIDLPSLVVAQAEAMRLAGAILLDEASLIHDHADWRLTVEDASGTVLLLVEFRVTSLLSSN